MTFLSTVATLALAQSAPTAAAQQPGVLGMLMPFALMFVVIYFLIIRPQQKKMKEHQTLLNQVQHGDEVVTTSGIFGTVTGVTDKVITLEIAKDVRVKMLKSQIASVESGKGAGQKTVAAKSTATQS